MTFEPTDVKALAPNGHLRAAINLGNPILANLDQATGKPFGVSVDLAHRLAERLQVSLELVVYDAAGKSVDGVIHGDADFGFLLLIPSGARTLHSPRPTSLSRDAI